MPFLKCLGVCRKTKIAKLKCLKKTYTSNTRLDRKLEKMSLQKCSKLCSVSLKKNFCAKNLKWPRQFPSHPTLDNQNRNHFREIMLMKQPLRLNLLNQSLSSTTMKLIDWLEATLSLKASLYLDFMKVSQLWGPHPKTMKKYPSSSHKVLVQWN